MYDPNIHRGSLSAVTWWNASSVDFKMESYVKKFGSTERNRCFANRDECSIKWNSTLKDLEILLKLGHILKGNNIAEVWIGRGNALILLKMQRKSFYIEMLVKISEYNTKTWVLIKFNKTGAGNIKQTSLFSRWHIFEYFCEVFTKCTNWIRGQNAI